MCVVSMCVNLLTGLSNADIRWKLLMYNRLNTGASESINLVGIPSCLINTGRKIVFFDIASMTPRLGAVCVLRAHYNRGLMSTAPRQLTADCAHCTCHQVQSACLCFALCCLDSRLSRLMTWEAYQAGTDWDIKLSNFSPV